MAPGGPGGPGGPAGRRGRERPNWAALGRAIRYLAHYRRLALLAYLFLFISSAAQLMVPQVVQGIIDTVSQALVTPEAATRTLLLFFALILLFTLVRAVFAYGQQYNAERVSQSIAFDFRNELFAKIQRLSFSYHDRNQTGQLMIRATDDVEKVRLVHRPGPGHRRAGACSADRHADRSCASPTPR